MEGEGCYSDGHASRCFIGRRVVPSKRGLRIGLTLAVLALGALQLVVRSGLLS